MEAGVLVEEVAWRSFRQMFPSARRLESCLHLQCLWPVFCPPWNPPALPSPTLTLSSCGGASGGVLVPRRRIQWHPRPRHLARSYSPIAPCLPCPAAPVKCMGLQQALAADQQRKWKRNPDEQKTRLPFGKRDSNDSSSDLRRPALSTLLLRVCKRAMVAQVAVSNLRIEGHFSMEPVST